jgi:hypothetical protein
VNKPIVDYINVNEDYRRTGIGTALYFAGANWMRNIGMQLYASSIQSDEARSVWSKFKNKGYVNSDGERKYLVPPTSKKNEMVGSTEPPSEEGHDMEMNPRMIVPSGNAVSDSAGSTGWDWMDPAYGQEKYGVTNMTENINEAPPIETFKTIGDFDKSSSLEILEIDVC